MKYGRWLLLQKYRHGKYMYCLVQCECGTIKECYFDNIKTGKSSSCGCYHKEIMFKNLYGFKHGYRKTNTGIYQTWRAMKNRCLNKNHPDFMYYGLKGIKITNKWLSFKGFKEDMEETYFDGATIDRINTKGNYNKYNCRWLTRSDNTKRELHLMRRNQRGQYQCKL